MAMGAVMVLVAIAMTANLDTRFQTAIASDLPDFLVNPTKVLESSRAVSSRSPGPLRRQAVIADPAQLDATSRCPTSGRRPSSPTTRSGSTPAEPLT